MFGDTYVSTANSNITETQELFLRIEKQLPVGQLPMY